VAVAVPVAVVAGAVGVQVGRQRALTTTGLGENQEAAGWRRRA